MVEKLNCWEFNKCGRDVSGRNTFEIGVCPASTNMTLDGVHGGISAGRACWAVPGTMCKGRIQRNVTRKYSECGSCDFYNYVKDEEGEEFIMTIDLLARLNNASSGSIVLRTVCSFSLEPIETCSVFKASSPQKICPYTLDSNTDCQSTHVIKTRLNTLGDSLKKYYQFVHKKNKRDMSSFFRQL